ncbi:MAG: Fic family protein [Dehalococcoidia bacterium]|nr:Fic family protein [Dehalococcoidia bacterium]
MNRLNIVRAVRGTTGIEGAEVSEDEVERILAAPASRGPVLGEARAREEREVRNASRVMEFIREVVREDSAHLLTEDDVREIHRLTTEGIDYPRNVPGKYREHDVHAGTYTAPPFGQVPTLMERFFEWFPETREREEWPECIRAVAAHFYLITIHPFGDGNGRTSRAVESLILYRGGINSLGFYSLANFYYQHRPEYEELLDRARFTHDGDLTEFVKFALDGLRDELERTHGEALGFLRELAFRDYAREALQIGGGLRSKTGERRFRLIQQILVAPVRLTELRGGRHAASALYGNATPKTLSRDINYLEEAGLVVEREGQLVANLDLMNQFVD